MKTILFLVAALQGAPVSGEIVSVSAEGKRVHVGLGRDSGLKVQDTLRIYSPPEIVSLPGTDKAAFGIEREIGAAVVVEVLERELIAQIVAATEPVAKGHRVVPGKPVRRGPLSPHIREKASFDPPQAFWGRVVTVTLDVEDLDGDLNRVECRVDRGLVLDPVTAIPRVRWLPPEKPGEVRLTVRVVDAGGLSDERAFTLRAEGIPPAARPAAFALESVFESPFLRAVDVASDAEGNLYLLDGDLRRILKWTVEGRRAWMTDSFGPEFDFVRLVVAGSDAFLVDRAGRRVLRYRLGLDMFGTDPVRVYGGRRSGPGALRDPVDVATLPTGDVWVLDAAERTIQTFSEDGTYQTAIGTFGMPRALRRGAGSAVHVLDTKNREILTFEAGRLAGKAALVSDELPVDFLDPSDPLFRARWGARALSEARAIRADAFGRVYILQAEGGTLLRMSPSREDMGRRQNVDLSSARSVQALPDGGFALESEAIRWVFDAEGWLRDVGDVSASQRHPHAQRDAAGNPYRLEGPSLKCGDRPLDLGTVRLSDFDLDPFGRLLLLEAGTGRVLRLSVTRWTP